MRVSEVSRSIQTATWDCYSASDIFCYFYFKRYCFSSQLCAVVDIGTGQEGWGLPIEAMLHVQWTLSKLPGQCRLPPELYVSSELWPHLLTRVAGVPAAFMGLWSLSCECCCCSFFFSLPFPTEFSSRKRMGWVVELNFWALCHVKAGDLATRSRSVISWAAQLGGRRCSCAMKSHPWLYGTATTPLTHPWLCGTAAVLQMIGLAPFEVKGTINMP